MPSTARHVLVVESHLDTLLTLQTALEEHDYTCQGAIDLTIALEQAAHADFDVLLTSLSGTGINGFDLIEELHARGILPRRVIVMLTDRERDLPTRPARGYVSAFLIKPVHWSALLVALAN